MLRKLGLFLSVFWWGSLFAGEPFFRTEACYKAVGQILKENQIEPTGLVATTQLDGLADVLASQGMPCGDVTYFTYLLKNVSKQGHPLTHRAILGLQDTIDNPKRHENFLFSVLRRDGNFKHLQARALYAYIPENYDTSYLFNPTPGVDPRPARAAIVKAKKPKPARVSIHTILLEMPEPTAKEINYFAAYFLHEFTHYLDNRLLLDWINASIQLILTDKPTDPLFDRLVVFDKDGNIHVHPALLGLFLEGRASYVQTVVEDQLFIVADRKAYFAEQRATAFEYLIERWPSLIDLKVLRVGDGPKDNFPSITKDNFQEAAMRMGGQMERTIQRAEDAGIYRRE